MERQPTPYVYTCFTTPAQRSQQKPEAASLLQQSISSSLARRNIRHEQESLLCRRCLCCRRIPTRFCSATNAYMAVTSRPNHVFTLLRTAALRLRNQRTTVVSQAKLDNLFIDGQGRGRQTTTFRPGRSRLHQENETRGRSLNTPLSHPSHAHRVMKTDGGHEATDPAIPFLPKHTHPTIGAKEAATRKIT